MRVFSVGVFSTWMGCVWMGGFYRTPHIKVITDDRVWSFAPEDPEQLDYWFDALHTALQPYQPQLVT